ncbi:hypothetical protein INT48_005232 [Thamnidium elegans]|uniref:Uncharacterized protein n=1 Tax=Thamnidium elegans TaxID=101142 RepID=A0A8H7SRQ1_9FUNG|nr:hypothetical protein INT48_005232 [Thamnidium elegans]
MRHHGGLQKKPTSPILKLYKDFRALGVFHNEKTRKWTDLTAAVNKVDAEDLEEGVRANPVSVKYVHEKLVEPIGMYRSFFDQFKNEKDSAKRIRVSVLLKKKRRKDNLDRKEKEMRELERDSIAGRRAHENKRKEEKKEGKGKGKAPEIIKFLNSDEDVIGEEEDNPIEVDNPDFLFKQSLDKRETDQSKVLQA